MGSESARGPIRFISIDDHPSISDSLRHAAAEYDDLDMLGSFVSIESVPKPLRSADFVDVVVVDLNLPGTAGNNAVQAVAGWGVPGLVFSANAQARIAQQCLDHGAAGFVSKSLPTTHVLDSIRAVSRGEVVMAGVEVAPATVLGLTDSDDRLLSALTVETQSKALAEMLFLSPRTVDNMITDLYVKTGLEGSDRNRAALRDWARARGFEQTDA